MENYKEKYFKYKQKYLELKHQIGGKLPSQIHQTHQTSIHPVLPLSQKLAEQKLEYKLAEQKLEQKLEHKLAEQELEQKLEQKLAEQKEYNNIINKFVYDYSHHLHRLLGFYSFDTDEYINIKKITIRKTLKPVFTIKPSTKYDVIIKFFIVTYLKKNLLKLKNSSYQFINYIGITIDDLIKEVLNFDIITYDIEIEVFKFNTPLLMMGGCPLYDGKKHIKGLIAIYTEPIIQFIHELCSSYYYYTLKNKNAELKQEKYLFPFIYTRTGVLLDPKMPLDTLKLYYDNIIEKLKTYTRIEHEVAKILSNLIANNKITFTMFEHRTYKKDILLHHIIYHPFVHNGFNNVDLIKQAGRVILPDELILECEHLEFIHSYLHSLDMLNMIKDDLINKKLKSYNLLIGCFPKSVYHICYEQILKLNQYTFLDSKQNIKPEAVPDKLKQYQLQIGDLHERYYEQLINHRISEHTRLSFPIGFDLYKINDLLKRYPRMIDLLRPSLTKELQYKDFKILIRRVLREYSIPKLDLIFIVKLIPQYIQLKNVIYVDDSDSDDFVALQTSDV
jgi:hypothetical protein